MKRPRLLDLFCGAGGCAVGYHRSGFDVVGVDLAPQPRYPFAFVQGDALEYLAAHGSEFDAIHASPPCQMYTAYRRCRPSKGDEHYVNLIPQTRELLAASGKPYVIENVSGSPLGFALTLCGSMFTPPLGVRRHRHFETNWLILSPGGCRHGVWQEVKYPGGRSRERGGARALCRKTAEIGRWNLSFDQQCEAMGIGWMTLPELSQAIPPAYTHYIGKRLLEQIQESTP